MKTVLITGASSGIGQAAASLLASKKEYRLILCGRRKEKLIHLSQELNSRFECENLILDFDIRDKDAVESAIVSIPDQFRKIDILVNNAGLALGLDSIEEGNTEHWDTMIDTNVKGLLYISKFVSQIMKTNLSGHIINIGSTAGKEAYPKGNAYCASKFAVDGLTKAMRMDLFSYNIKVSQIAPGHVENTEFAITRFEGDAQRAKIYEDFTPLQPADVADTIEFIITRPPHVMVHDVVLTSTQQASAIMIDRTGRKYSLDQV